jgi:hypothetical protein
MWKGRLGGELLLRGTEIQQGALEAALRGWLESSGLTTGKVGLANPRSTGGAVLNTAERIRCYGAQYPRDRCGPVAWAVGLLWYRVLGVVPLIEVFPMGPGAPWGPLRFGAHPTWLAAGADGGRVRAPAQWLYTIRLIVEARPGQRAWIRQGPGGDPDEGPGLGRRTARALVQEWLREAAIEATSVTELHPREFRWLSTVGGALRYWSRCLAASTRA